jgi:hypothetical protein
MHVSTPLTLETGSVLTLSAANKVCSHAYNVAFGISVVQNGYVNHACWGLEV